MDDGIVETLDKCFENVCELDLIFHVDKVHNILAEMVMGGMVLETNMNEIVTQIDAQNKLEKSENLTFLCIIVKKQRSMNLIFPDKNNELLPAFKEKFQNKLQVNETLKIPPPKPANEIVLYRENKIISAICKDDVEILKLIIQP
ncbi:hypothetical protein DUI87_26366 [Hirundo rustica rustica]|uniref:AP complex mu/sigma subunit domain-containing protein n=1 Tax=Hirundo rustica rustica TaxID=333673 RepID=A0A3M0JDS7_HIRRU|nr:hypothetical protein DUI87_26366 [Hirundo rustica rustica]